MHNEVGTEGIVDEISFFIMKNASLHAAPFQRDGGQGAACDIEDVPESFDFQAIIEINKKITVWRIKEIDEKFHDHVSRTVHDVIQVDIKTA